MKRAVMACMIAGLFAALDAVAAVDASRFEFVKQICPAGPAGNEIGRFALDDDVYELADSNYGNIRITTSDGRECRFLVRRQARTEYRACEFDIPATTASFQKLPDNRIEVVLDTGRDPAAAAYLDLATANRNFEKQVSVYAGNDGVTWTSVAENQPIFDYSRYVDLENSRVKLRNAGSFRFYRVEVSDITETNRSPFRTVVRSLRDQGAEDIVESFTTTESTLRIDGLALRGERQTALAHQPVLAWYKVEDTAVTNDAKSQVTIVSCRLRRQPVTAFYVDTADANFARDVRVEIPQADVEGKETWRPVSAGRIRRVRLGGIERDQVKIPLGTVLRADRFRVVINNQDNPPLSVAGIRAQGEVMEALFLAEPGASYRLLCTAGAVESPSYDIESVIGNQPDSGIFDCTLSAREKNSAYRGPGRARQPYGSRRVFIAALVVMVAALVWIIARAARNVETLPRS